MTFPWVINLAREDAAALAGLRLLPNVEVAEEGNAVWLRGPPEDDPLKLRQRLNALPAFARFELLGGHSLRPMDQRVPAGELPQLSWQPLKTWLQVELPPAALTGNRPPRVTLHLVHSTVEQEPEVLLTTVTEFEPFVMRAAQIRLAHLQFAADERGRIVARGKPLPPVPGKHFVLHGSVAVAAGFHWTPAVSADVLGRVLGAGGETFVLWEENGTVTRVHPEQFVAVTRSAVRATAEALGQNS